MWAVKMRKENRMTKEDGFMKSKPSLRPRPYRKPARLFTSLSVQGYDVDGRYVAFAVHLVEGEITENGHCRLIDHN